MERRELFRIAAASAAAAATGLGQQQPSASVPSAPRFFSAEEFRRLGELCERIIPADEESGGALAAGVPIYIDTLAFRGDAASQKSWRDGLTALVGEPTLDAVVAKERNPDTDAERFFVRLKAVTIEAYFQSSVGMKYTGFHDHGGVHEFPGCPHPGHHQDA